MFVIKRNGERAPMRYDCITERNIALSKDLDINPEYLSKMVIQSLKTGMTTNEIDDLAAETAAYMSTYEPDYDTLAARISISNHQKNTSSSLLETMKKLRGFIDTKTGKEVNIIREELIQFVELHQTDIDSAIDYSKDFNYSYFGFKTLQRLYLLKAGECIVERPQHMIMRVALELHFRDGIERVIDTYRDMSDGYYTHASPTLFNAGTIKNQSSSCFLLSMEDELEHIYETTKRCALISKHGGGIGIDISKVRCKGSRIHSTNGTSDGLVPMIKVLNATSVYCNQCFTPETIIYTKNGQKQIKDVQPLDEVITIDGTFKPVIDVFTNEVDKEILKIRSTYSFEDIGVTKEHQVLAIRGQSKSTNFNVILNRLNKNIITPEYVSASELNTNDFIGFPIQKLPRTDNYKTYGNDFFRFYGIMLGDGCIRSNRNEASVTLNEQSKINTLLFVRNYLTKLGIHYWETKGINCINVRWTNTHSGITYDDLYNQNKDKRIHVKYMNLTRKHRIHLIKGLIETDGSNLKEVYFSTSSYELGHNIRYLLLSLGILSSGHNRKIELNTPREIRPGKYIINRKKAYNIRISKHPVLSEIMDVKQQGLFTKYFIYNNIIWSRIKKISTYNYAGKVYDLGILNNNNYVVGSFGIVHNSGKRKGSFAAYLQPWHADIFDFLALRYNTPPEELRARDIFLAVWMNDLFMKRVEEPNGVWSLFCPSVVPELNETFGDEFEQIYLKAESEGKYVRQIKARELWEKIMHAQIETGLPYISYKDSINKKNMQSNIGIIRSSNLCNEIVEVTSKDSVAVCNLASVSLPKFVEYSSDNTPIFNYDKLYHITKKIVRNIDNIMDTNYYPINEAKTNNIDYRPMGIGLQGLADVFAMFKVGWENNVTSKDLNRRISETMYYAAVEASHELALERGSYSAFEGSPYSKGILQYHLWNSKPVTSFDWEGLSQKVKKGMRNSLLIALMPTASSSQILNNNEAAEAFTSNIYSRVTLAGNFIMMNKHLVRDLKALKLWNKELVNKIIEHDGSVQTITEIPEDVRKVYKTVWEISQREIIDMAADRGPFVDQTQSMNIFIDRPTNSRLTSMHFYGWKKGLKTGMYYLRSKPSRSAVKFSLMNTSTEEKKGVEYKDKVTGKIMVCTEDVCTMCSS